MLILFIRTLAKSQILTLVSNYFIGYKLTSWNARVLDEDLLNYQEGIIHNYDTLFLARYAVAS